MGQDRVWVVFRGVYTTCRREICVTTNAALGLREKDTGVRSIWTAQIVYLKDPTQRVVDDPERVLA